MKKIFIFLMALMMSFGIANAQIATENSKFFDNTYVTVNAGASTPMCFESNSHSFGVNPVAGVAVGKWFTPVFGVEIEGTAWFGDHNHGQLFLAGPSNVVAGHYLGVNGLMNFSNLFASYKGTPRLFEVSLMTGLGWLHSYNKGPNTNGIGLKTGLDLAFNLGKTKAHTLSIRPAIYWDLNKANNDGTCYVTFNPKNAQLYLGVAYTYHFKTSNGTHHFKTYDVGVMKEEITRLNTALQKKPRIIEKVVIKKDPIVNQQMPSIKESIYFAFNSTELDERAKETLNQLDVNEVYVIDAWASSEGNAEYNLKLSQRRADAVKAYLESRGAKVESATGHGVQFGNTTGRVAIVQFK